MLTSRSMSAVRKLKESRMANQSIDEATESLRRDLTGRHKQVVFALGIVLAFAQVYLVVFGLASPQVHASTFLAFIAPITVLSYRAYPSAPRERIPLYDWALAALTSAPFIYGAFFYDDLIMRAIRPTELDTAMAVLAVLAVLEIARRAVGIILPVIAGLFLVYALWGGALPGVLSHRGYGLGRLTNTMFMTTNGLFSSPSQVAATMVFMFVFFGAFLQSTGGSRVITDIAFALAGRFTGGPAKVAVLSSAGLGMVSGSSSANVATTGQVTIPLMRQVGYGRKFAASVEASASTVGTLTPPIMGAAAFIMAEITGIPYAEIVVAGIVPALLFYVSILACVHLEATKLGLGGLKRDQLPRLGKTIRTGGVILLPVGLLVALIFMYYPVMHAAFYSTLGLIVVGLIHPRIRFGVRDVFTSMSSAAQMAIQAASACAAAGIVVGVLNLTGLGLRFSSWTLQIAGTSAVLALLFTMVITIILGMGLPPVAAYIVAASITAPALAELGFPLLAAHMFVFYFSCLSAITPPVGVTAFIGAGISGASPMGTALQSSILSLPAFVVPYLFMYSSSLLLDGSPMYVTTSLVTGIIGVAAFAVAVIGHLRDRCPIWQRAAFLIGGGLALVPVWQYAIAGLVVLAVVVTVHFLGSASTSSDSEVSSA